LNGLELAERIRKMPGLSDLPMIMLTSYSDDETKRKGLAAGMRAYLTKGQFDQTKFLDTVRKLIGQPMEEL
jgi:CheY-like chemotaxis protein